MALYSIHLKKQSLVNSFEDDFEMSEDIEIIFSIIEVVLFML
jgi:hypothetical protein